LKGEILFCENSIMKRENGKKCVQVCSFLALLAMMMFFTVAPTNVTAKSLYVIAEKGTIGDADRTIPLHAYNIEPDGTLTFQTEHRIPRNMLGAVGIAIDTDSETLFITYHHSGELELVNARTMTSIGSAVAPGAYDLAAIVYDHSKQQVYCSNFGWRGLYVYNWDSDTSTLTHVQGSPITLKRAQVNGIALNEIDGLLYVANGTDNVTVYDTTTWRLVDTIELDRIAISIALGVARGYLYTGAGYAGNPYLTQYDLATGEIREVQVETDGAGVMGLGVDPATGHVYLTTGANNAPGGDNLHVYDTKLNKIDFIPSIGNPTGLVVPGKDIGYNPLNLKKTLVRGGSGSSSSEETPIVGAGTTITYGIHFDNFNDFAATGVIVTDQLPDEVTLVSADDDGINGQYDSKTHTYEWFYPSLPIGTSIDLELTVDVKKDVELDTVIRNSVTINSNETALAASYFDVAVQNNALNLTKSIVGVVEGQTAWVDPDAPMTYTICFDNNNNDFPVTNVSIVDYLPDEVQFVGLGKDTPSGKYDAGEHTYTWTLSSLLPGEAVCWDLNVKVNKNVAPDTTITNSVMIDSSETPPSMASAEAVTYHNTLRLRKSIVGAEEDKIPLVSPNETLTYEIYFDNLEGDAPVHNVTLIDVLPPEVTFVKTVDDRNAGQYDPDTHTYTWWFGSLSSQIGTYLELVVKVNEETSPSTTITNYVTLDTDETRPITASADAITKYKNLNIRKEIVGDSIGGTLFANPGEIVTYRICFDNDNDSPVTNVSVVDSLPDEVVFVSASGNKDYGTYDEFSHTYTWTYKSIPAESTTCEMLDVRIKESTPRDRIIVNRVRIQSDQTDESENPPDDNEINTGEEPTALQEFSILPEIIRATDQNYEIQATAILPAGIGKKDIEDEPPVLYLPEPYAAKIVATRQIIYGSDTRAKVIAMFDKIELLNAINAYGPFRLTVVGKLKKGQSWYGEDTVYITRYTGQPNR